MYEVLLFKSRRHLCKGSMVNLDKMNFFHNETPRVSSTFSSAGRVEFSQAD